MRIQGMTRAFAILVFVAALAFAVAPLLTPGFGGFEPGQFPVPQDDPPVQPAGWAFAIWSVIYLWLILGSGFGLLKRADDPDWAPMRPWLFASLAPGAAWLAVALVSPVWATVLIWWMLLTALMALAKAGQADRWWQRAPVALYTGWLTAAASVSLGLLAAGYGLAGALPAAIGALVVAVVLALAVQTRRPDAPEYGIAVIWALAGVIASNLAPPVWVVIVLAGLGIVALILRMVLPRWPYPLGGRTR